MVVFIALPTITNAVPSTWTCAPAAYNAGDGICNCACGAPDPDCLIQNNASLNDTSPEMSNTTVSPVLVGCPCQAMVCTADGHCYGSCNAQDFNVVRNRAIFFEVLTIINTILIAVILFILISLIAIRLYEDMQKSSAYGLEEQDSLLDSICGYVNKVLTLGGRCHKVPTIPTRRERIAKYERKALLHALPKKEEVH